MNYLKNPWIPFIFKNRFIKLPVAKGMTYNLFQLRRNWMTSLLENLTKLQGKDDFFFDIGANLGQTLINFSTVSNGKYIGFEPDPFCIVYLRKLIELNKITNALIAPVGLSNCNQLAKLYSSSPTDSGATLRENLRPSRELYSAFVPTFRLDDVVQKLGLRSVTLIKIDVEGWELEVLKGMSNIFQLNRPIIICEVIFRDEKALPEEHQQRNLEIFKILNSYNYNIFQLIKAFDWENIQQIKEIYQFSNETWTKDNQNLCDYLFVPEEKKEQVLSLYS